MCLFAFLVILLLFMMSCHVASCPALLLFPAWMYRNPQLKEIQHTYCSCQRHARLPENVFVRYPILLKHFLKFDGIYVRERSSYSSLVGCAHIRLMRSFASSLINTRSWSRLAGSASIATLGAFLAVSPNNAPRDRYLALFRRNLGLIVSYVVQQRHHITSHVHVIFSLM